MNQQNLSDYFISETGQNSERRQVFTNISNKHLPVDTSELQFYVDWCSLNLIDAD